MLRQLRGGKYVSWPAALLGGESAGLHHRIITLRNLHFESSAGFLPPPKIPKIWPRTPFFFSVSSEGSGVVWLGFAPRAALCWFCSPDAPGDELAPEAGG